MGRPVIKVVEILIALFLPPIAVLMKRGVGTSLLLSIVLTLLGHLPGVVHAIYVVTQDPTPAPA